MVCIYCHGETEVTNSRAKARTPSVWRRRACKDCVAQFTTTELPDYEKSLLVSSLNNKKLYAFSRDKLFLSLYQSLGHRKDALDSSTALTGTVIGRLLRDMSRLRGQAAQTQKNGLIYTTSIAQLSYQVLKRFDPLAATTYKAYHQAALKRSIDNN